jgi:hypothetical protein
LIPRIPNLKCWEIFQLAYLKLYKTEQILIEKSSVENLVMFFSVKEKAFYVFFTVVLLSVLHVGTYVLRPEQNKLNYLMHETEKNQHWADFSLEENILIFALQVLASFFLIVWAGFLNH